MCGIIGFIGKRDAAQIVIDGMRHLEYRGYDSCGIVISNGKDLSIMKDVGKMEEVFGNADIASFKGNMGIGHTRWATHGGVTKENAHPHLSNNNKIAVVHNGIIENYLELKQMLIKEGFVFKSQTDTEVIPLLIEYNMKKHNMDFKDATKAALKMLEGQWAIVAMHVDENKLIAARHEAPLVIGIGNDEYFVASDIPAFLRYTKNVIYLDDYDMTTISPDGVSVLNLKKNITVQKEIHSIEWSAEQAEKGNFDHFMLKEIFEQSEVIKRAIAQPKEDIDAVAKEIKNAKHVYLTACGTSYHTCLTARYIFSKIANKNVNVIYAHEFKYFKHFIGKDSLVIAVSQSGETAETLEAMRIAKEAGAKTIAITNVMGSSAARECDQALMQQAGPEISVISTKTYTSQLAILSLIAYAIADKFEEGKDALKNVAMLIFHLTSENARKYTKELAEKLRYTNHIYLIGRSIGYPTALEAALKIKEVSYIHAEAYAAGELKHGTIALIEYGTPCIIFTSEETEKEIFSSAEELKARGAYIIGVGPKRHKVFDHWIKIWDGGVFNPIIQIIPMQILAYQLAILRGCDPDKPRNLAKSVTVK